MLSTSKRSAFLTSSEIFTLKDCSCSRSSFSTLTFMLHVFIYTFLYIQSYKEIVKGGLLALGRIKIKLTFRIIGAFLILLQKPGKIWSTILIFETSAHELVRFASLANFSFFFRSFSYLRKIFGGDLSAGSPTDTLLRLSPPHKIVVQHDPSGIQRIMHHHNFAWVTWRAVCARSGDIFTARCWQAITRDSIFMRASFSPQSELRMGLWDWLLLSELQPIVPSIVCHVWPRRLGLYWPTVAPSFLLLTQAVCLECTTFEKVVGN